MAFWSVQDYGVKPGSHSARDCEHLPWAIPPYGVQDLPDSECPARGIRPSRPVRRCGAKPDPPDLRDKRLRFSDMEVPDHGKKDLRKYIPAVYDQGQIGSCTANAVCAAYRMDLMKEGKEPFEPSRLFLYYNTRKIEGHTDWDSGASLRDTVKAMSNGDKGCGVCRENKPQPYWAYDEGKLTVAPPQECYDAAKGNIIKLYEKLQDPHQIDQTRTCLHNEYPLVFGFKVFPNFEDSAGGCGTLAMPTLDDLENFDGGRHAVVAVGYNDDKETVTILNSWGAGWGVMKGYFNMPYKFITNKDYCFDFWKIEFVSEESKYLPPTTYRAGREVSSEYTPRTSYRAGREAWSDTPRTSYRAGREAWSDTPQTSYRAGREAWSDTPRTSYRAGREAWSDTPRTTYRTGREVWSDTPWATYRAGREPSSEYPTRSTHQAVGEVWPEYTRRVNHVEKPCCCCSVM